MSITADVARVRYQQGQFLGAQDFQDEQDYLVRLRRLHWMLAHPWGIVRGLRVEQDKLTAAFVLRPGVAVDAWGREIIVSRDVALDVAAIADVVPANLALPVKVNVWVQYCSMPTRPPKVCGPCESAVRFTRLSETWTLDYTLGGQDPAFDTLGPDAEPPPYHADFVRRMESARWPVFLGQLTYGVDADNPRPHVLKFDIADANGLWRRRDVQTHVLAPHRTAIDAAEMRPIVTDVTLSAAGPSLSAVASSGVTPAATVTPAREVEVTRRGEGRLVRGRVTIELPDDFDRVAARPGRTVQVTPLFTKVDEPVSPLAVSAVEGDSFSVRALDRKNLSQRFYWEVKALSAGEHG